ncbi:putative beta-lysine N-acetyltransferase [Clostridium magnum]|uniref:N-acetyltransferase YodP n=1 Tax=Clostridium magnum DSM 2767 TaxID=1121326 RepID=A0A168DTB0_9CLOT|nr:putative beta-lysine N-acetyltransferase [Clostridium magnum]KZL91449.1 N-acetyltransferase YodP [Clostridium magnum DSM 2767]SHH42707.1 beta-lysine acetyltransferase [Clostridium magnum DSM 2767]
MNIECCKLNDKNYYTKIDQAKIYVDYINSRIKIVKFHNISVQNIRRIVYFASRQHIGKIICNCDIESFANFVEAEFHLEGKIDGYFNGKDAFCMSYFIKSSRKLYRNKDKENIILMKSLNLRNSFIYNANNFKYHIRDANENDIKSMIELFSNVFFTYPSPVHDEEYLKKTMNKKVLYKVAIDNGKIISIASADLDKENLNAEITDCVTSPQYRGQGILSNIIYSLEQDLKHRGFIGLYSLSRAVNPGINFVLSKHDYRFRGRLINNCNICGGFENMNIWVKNIN